MQVPAANVRGRIRSRIDAGRAQVLVWPEQSIALWHAEGRIGADEAAALREEIAAPHFQTLLPHLIMHLTFSMLLPFPFASLARAGWTTWLLLLATTRLLTGRIDRHDWQRAWNIHHPLVIVLALVPAIGGASYLASKVMWGNLLLVRAMLDTLLRRAPWHLYQRSRLQRVVIGRPRG